jgi:DNA-binding CsgD family transcriptional regulator
MANGRSSTGGRAHRATAPHFQIVPSSDLRRRRVELLDAGQAVLDGFAVDELAGSAEPEVTCVGGVATAEQAAAAVLAAVRGASLVIAVTLRGAARHRLVEDLAKLGPVRVADVAVDLGSGRSRPIDPLTPEERALLDQLAAGRSVAEAARQVGFSLRSAHRRLAELRARMAVTNNAQLLMEVDRPSPADPQGAAGEPRGVTLSLPREREVQRLVSSIASGRAVVVTGAAGIGKTTLLRLATARCGVKVFEGGGIASLQWMPFLPLDRAVGSPPTGADAAGVAHHVVERVGDGVLVLDDLQWSDTGTLGLLPQLTAGIPVIAAVRLGDPSTEAALAPLVRAGAECIQLDELPPGDALAFLRARRPELSDEQLRSVLARAGGNPLFLDELGAEASPTLRASLLARLGPLGHEALAGLARLALLGRPSPPEVVGRELAGLVEVGLVHLAGGQVHLRHDLIGAEVLTMIDPPEQRALHGELAEILPPAEAARHHLAAGDRHRARASALLGADRASFPAERARNLLLAADCDGCVAATCDGCADLDLRLRAVDASLEAGDVAEAMDTIDAITGSNRVAEVELRRARASWQAGDPEAAREAAEVGLRFAAWTASPTEVALRVEQLRYPIRVQFDADRALVLATETWALARSVGAEETRARILLGSASLVAGSDDWSAHIEAALRQARMDDDLDAVFEASNALVAAHMLSGDRTVAYRAAEAAEVMARDAHRRRWQEQFSITARLLALLAGRCEEVAEWGRDFVRPDLTVAVHTAYGVYALALADLGLSRDALAVIARGLGIGDATGASLLSWAEAETHWLSEHPDRALEAAEDCLRGAAAHFPVHPLAGVLRAWAEFDLGLEPRTVDTPGGPSPRRRARVAVSGSSSQATFRPPSSASKPPRASPLMHPGSRSGRGGVRPKPFGVRASSIGRSSCSSTSRQPQPGDGSTPSPAGYAVPSGWRATDRPSASILTRC